MERRGTASPRVFDLSARSGGSRSGGRGRPSRSATAALSPARRRSFGSSSNNGNQQLSRQRGSTSTSGRRPGIGLDAPEISRLAARRRRGSTSISSPGAVSGQVAPSAENRAASSAAAEASPRPSAPPPPSPPPSSEAASEQAMRLLKRMKPNELREISKAATALEKSKLEDSKKVRALSVGLLGSGFPSHGKIVFRKLKVVRVL